MRSVTAFGASILIIVPLVAFGPPAHADSNNDLLGQAQRFLNGNNNNDSDRDAYERGRDDQMRRDQARRDRDRYRHDYDQGFNRDRDDQRWSNDTRYRDPNYGYNDRR